MFFSDNPITEAIRTGNLDALSVLIDQNIHLLSSKVWTHHSYQRTELDLALDCDLPSENRMPITQLLFASGLNTRANRLDRYKHFDSPQKLIAFLKSNESKPLVFNRAFSVVADYPMPNLWASLFDPNPKHPKTPEEIKSDIAKFYQKLEGFSHWYQYEIQETELRFPNNHETFEAFKKYLRCFDLKYYKKVLCANLDELDDGNHLLKENQQDQMVYRYYQSCEKSGFTPPKPITFQDLQKAFEEESFNQDRIENLIKKLSPKTKQIALQWVSYRYSKEESREKSEKFLLVLELLYTNGANKIDKDLIEAIEISDLKRITQLIHDGVQLNTQTGHNTPLTIAAKKGDAHVVELLIQHGALVNPTMSDYTPLMCAIASNHPNRLNLVEILLKNKAEANPEHRLKGSTPLLLALAEQKTAIAKLLVLNGANVNDRRESFDHPLQYAFETEDLELMCLIFHRTSNIVASTLKLSFSKEPLLLDYSITNGDEKLLRFLIKHNSDILIEYNQSINRLIDTNRVHKNLKKHLCHFDNPETFSYYLKHHENTENRAFFDRACATVSDNSRLRMWARLFDPNRPNPQHPRTQETIDSKTKQFYARLQGFSAWHQTTTHIHLRPHQERWQAFRTYLKGYEQEEALMLALNARDSQFKALPFDIKDLIAEQLMTKQPNIRMAYLYHQFPAQRFREAEAKRKADRELRADATERRMARNFLG